MIQLVSRNKKYFVLHRLILSFSGAIAISLYIIACWVPQIRREYSLQLFISILIDPIFALTGQIRNLTGYTAPAQFLQQLTWVAFHHSPLVRKIDTVRAYHFGTHFLVEVDVLLPPDLRLGEAVHVAIGLEQKIEALPDVERAFVHLNCEHGNNDPENRIGDQDRQVVLAVNRRQHKVV